MGPYVKKLSSVRFSAVAKGDAKPPYYLSGLSSEDKRKKEMSVFDRAITELCGKVQNLIHLKFTLFQFCQNHALVPVTMKIILYESFSRLLQIKSVNMHLFTRK